MISRATSILAINLAILEFVISQQNTDISLKILLYCLSVVAFFIASVGLSEWFRIGSNKPTQFYEYATKDSGQPTRFYDYANAREIPPWIGRWHREQKAEEEELRKRSMHKDGFVDKDEQEGMVEDLNAQAGK